jgi:hypothetical protein
MADRMGTTNVSCSYDLGTNHPALTFTVKITIPLSGTAWAAIFAVVPMTDRMGARLLAKVCFSTYLITHQSRAAFCICITISLAFCTWSAIFAIIPMAYGVWASIRSFAYVDLIWDLVTGQSVLTFTVAIAITFSFGTGGAILTVVPIA